MPRLNGEEYVPGPLVPEGTKPTDELFVVRASNEGVRTYEEYLSKSNLYRRRDWQNAVTGKGSFTYEEALRDEEKTLAQLAKFPRDVEGTVVKMVHHSTAKLDDLLATIYDAFRPAPGSNDKENAADNDGGKKEAHPLGSKRVIRTFLGEVAEKLGGLWVVKAKYADKWDLPKEVPEDKKALLPSSARKKAKRDSMQGESGGAGSGEGKTARPPLPPPRSLEEEEARLKPGSLKAFAFTALRDAGPSGLSCPAALDKIKAASGDKEWPKSVANMLTSIFTSDTTFCRVARGVYALRALPGVVPMPDAPKPEAASGGGAKPEATAAGDGKVSRSGSVAIDQQPSGEVDGVAAAETNLKRAKSAMALRQKELTAADAALEEAKKALEDARAAQQAAAKAGGASPGKAGAAGASEAGPVGGDEEPEPQWELPKELQGEFTGPTDDRKGLLAFRKAKAEAEKKLQVQREKWLQERRLAAVKATQGAVARLKAAADRAASAREAAVGSVARAAKAVADCERAVERERQRAAIKSMKEREKEIKEAARLADKEERERRRAEALAARRYPIDDAELICELATKAAATLGASAAAALATAADAGSAGPSPSAAGGKKGGKKAAAAAAASKAAAAAAAAASEAADGAEKDASDKSPAFDPVGDALAASGARRLASDEGRALGDLLFVSDFVSSFAKPLKLRGGLPGGANALSAALDALGPKGSGDVAASQQWLEAVYKALLMPVIRDQETVFNIDGRQAARWAGALAQQGTWPEVLRRYIFWRRDCFDAPFVEEDVWRAACALSKSPGASALNRNQHLALLRFLADEALDTDVIREALNARMEVAAEKAASLRADLAEERKRLKELADAEKEERKRKRAERLAAQQAAAAAAHAAHAAAAAAGGAVPEGAEEDKAAGGSEGGAPAAKKAKTEPSKAGRSSGGESDSDEEEPSWELPESLREYSGVAGDRKAMAAFRQEQQAARQRLEKEKAKWHADVKARKKARDAERKAAEEEEKKRARAKAETEETIASRLEDLEKELEKCAIRRAPLGADRHHRAVWWGVASHGSALIVQQDPSALEANRARWADAAGGAAASGGRAAVAGAGEEQWLAVESAEGAEGLATALDVRGAREKELRAALDKSLPEITTALQKATAARESSEPPAGAAAPKPPKHEKGDRAPPARELPSRSARRVAEEQIRAQAGAEEKGADGKKGRSAAAAPPPPPPREGLAGGGDFGGLFAAEFAWDGAAMLTAADCAAALASAASSARAPGPAGGWAQWRRKIEAMASNAEIDGGWLEDAEEAAAGGGANASPEEAKAAAIATAPKALQGDRGLLFVQLKLRLLELEEHLVAATGELELYGDEQSEEEEEEEEEAQEEEEEEEEQEEEQPKKGRGGKRGRGGRAAGGRGGKRARGSEDEEEKDEEGDTEMGEASGSAGKGSKGGRKGIRRGSAATEEDEEEEGRRVPRSAAKTRHHNAAALVAKEANDVDPDAFAPVFDSEIPRDEDSLIPATRLPTCIWRTAAERAAWRAAAEAAGTAAALGYCAAALGEHGEGPVAALRGKKGGK